MASAGSTQAIIKRREDEMQLMPPPPTKRIKRPTEALDEDEYTEALSNIIERDYFPGLREAKAQEEYLQALDSKNPTWIKESEKKLRAATNGEMIKKTPRETRDGRYDTPRTYRPAQDTPRGSTSEETPTFHTDQSDGEKHSGKDEVDVSTISLSEYQAKYTSEDNSSFNDVLDKQNEKRRQKHAHLWTADQKIPSQRLLTQRAKEQALVKDKTEYESFNGKTLVQLTSGANSDRSAKPASWKTKSPANTFMFVPQTSADEQGLITIQQQKEAMSKAAPKQIVYENTRFPPSGPRWEAEEEDDATSIHTSFIARRNADGTDAGTISGAETPRVNGYTFVDDEDSSPSERREPTYRDLLAGQTGDMTPNPFKLKQNTSREILHHKLVERDAEKKKNIQQKVLPDRKQSGNMTPAGRRMLERLSGRTPQMSPKVSTKVENWTPVAAARRGISD